MFALLALMPMLVTLAGLALFAPALVRAHVRTAEAPQEPDLTQDGWAAWLLSDLDEPDPTQLDAEWPSHPRCGQYQRQPRRMARAVQRSRQHQAAWALLRSPRPETCPPTLRTPYAQGLAQSLH